MRYCSDRCNTCRSFDDPWDSFRCSICCNGNKYKPMSIESLYPKTMIVTTGRQNGKTELQKFYEYLTSLKVTEQCAAWAKANLCIPKETLPEIKDVIFNNPATIVFWEDGTKTVVKATDEGFDPEKGLAMAITKKVYGNKGNYFNKIKKWTKNVVNLRGMIVRLNEKRDRDRLAKAYTVLNSAYVDRKATKSDLGIAIEEAIGLLGQVLDD